jgi:predicted transcriptional regulator
VREWRSPILSELGKIHPYIFNYTDKSKDIGLMAQEVEAILPQLVKEGVRGKYVNYDGVVSLLVKGVQELSARVSTLEGLRS